ncbi:MAG: hypothetical protein A2086_10940 [Spirochaetes bacterium GWD1_27_9]|nr:MAG: hypothetical protein A2086_10940 [Spirochaetes bacterium GWD1_27_9]
MLGSPNGEDFLYSFYNEETGEYNLLQYNLIGKKVETPIKCNGYLIFDDGRMIFFKADNEPKKSHLIQIWQTPFVSDINFTFKDNNSLLCKIGNSSLVKGISELRQIYSLIQREKIYLSLYNDISKSVTNTLDLYYWLDKEEAFDPKEVLVEIRNNANSAINEYEKVINIKKDTQNRIFSAENDTKKLVEEYETTSFDTIQKFIDFLAVLQNKKGTIITLKDLRYSDIEKINGLESQINSKYDELSIKCIDFLLLPDSFNPLLEQLKKYNDILGTIKKVTDLKEVETEIDKLNASLDLLNEIVTNLKIEDATKTSLIIDRISNIYANLNQLKIAFKKYKIELNSKEMTVEFSSQFKLLSQNVTNFLEQANTTQKCDELLTKILIKIDELLSKFSDFDEYTEKLNLKREEIYSSFNNKRIQLNEAKNKKTINLQKNANRIFETIILKLKSFLTIDEINSYFASDLMVLKVNEIIKDLFELGDTVKSEDIASKLKSLKQDGIRQLKDKTELYNGDLIKFGNYQFTVNKEQFGLAMVEKEDEMFYHLSATDFFERVDDKDFEDTKEFWVYESGNQNQEIYRAYYLSYLFLNDIVKDTNKIVTKNEFEKIIDKKDDALKIIRDYINQIGFEGCEKGIHDEDTIKILKSVYPTYKNSGILKYHPLTRFYAVIFILFYHNIDEKNLLLNKIKSHSTLAKLLKKDANPDIIIEEIKEKMSLFYSESKIKIDQKYFALSPNYLFEELSTVDFETPFDDIKFSVNKISYDIFNSFTKYLKLQKYYDKFYSLIDNLKNDFTGKIDIIRIWVTNYFDVEVKSHNAKEFIDEIVFTLLINSIHQANFDKKIKVLDFNTICKVENLASIHSTIIENKMIFDISDFWLDNFFFHNNIVPRYKKYQSIKQSLILQKKDEMALDEFIPKILTSFVRNRLIDKVYLNIIGANLAKQIGAYGEQKRTDLMGMLLLISPPGYGKTTLMEYIAERLGLIFVKINAPALGNRVTSLDPAEAPNITAKKEIEKLNFALEMGNNVMLYVDDIQHSNPEFLQKFISLCDAQRMIEGVYKSKTKRYDFRGKKFCVVMAGNPYTESGEKFRIPDMLANRSDVYNLGDIIGSNIDDFNLSYIENSLTSNPVLNKLVSRSQSDFYELLKIAKTGVNENVSLSSKYSMEELNECVAILKKLLLVQQIILEVNKLYIYSAGQDPQYREEPQFLLQGSYRNMNKIAEKILPIINDTELKQIIEDHYRYEAQLLTTGAEFNFLRFKELSNFATPEEKTRLDSIRKTFNKNKILGKKDDKDPFGAIISQISYFNEQFGGLLDEYRKK